VVFLASNQAQDQAEHAAEGLEAMEPRNQVERDLMSQLDQVKTRAAKSSDTSKKASKTVVTDTPFLNDEPPFKDDLPF
jgi:hypothetical protein